MGYDDGFAFWIYLVVMYILTGAEFIASTTVAGLKLFPPCTSTNLAPYAITLGFFITNIAVVVVCCAILGCASMCENCQVE